MTQTTPTLALVLPGGGSTGLNTPPDRVDIDVLNNNFEKIDDYAETVGNNLNRSFLYYGPAANIGSVVPLPKDGDEYQESDGNKTRWRRIGGNWVRNVGGLLLVRPGAASGTGVTINANGSVEVAPSSPAGRINIDNVFDASRYRRYKIVHSVGKAAATNLTSTVFRTTAPADLVAAAGHYNSSMYALNGAAVASSYANAVGNLGGILDAVGAITVLDADVFFSPDNTAVLIQGVVSGRAGGVETRTFTASVEGITASSIGGLGINYGQQVSGAKWTFYAYQD